MKEYQIIEHGVVVGRFDMSSHRDESFQRYFMDKGRMAFKKDVEIGAVWSSQKKRSD